MIVVTGTAAVILICLGVAVYVLEFAGKTARYKDRRSGRSRYGHVELGPAKADTASVADKHRRSGRSRYGQVDLGPVSADQALRTRDVESKHAGEGA
jgi:hypothetical protein